MPNAANTAYSPIAQQTILAIRGPEARAFLQGQATCDLETLTAERAIHGGLCNPQGRLYSSFLLVADGTEDIYLRLSRDILAATASALGKYIVFSRAELDQDADTPAVYGVWGPGSKEVLQLTTDETNPGYLSVSHNCGDTIVQMNEEGSRFECWIRDTENSALLQAIQSSNVGSEEVWKHSSIKAGLAHIEAAIVDQFIPQMLNFDLTGHVSFTKGCYTGQEVVARLHYRGTAKRRAFPVEIPGYQGARDLSGEAIYSAESSQSVGNIVNACNPPDGPVAALAVLTRKLVGATALHLGSPTGPELAISDPPYTLPDG